MPQNREELCPPFGELDPTQNLALAEALACVQRISERANAQIREEPKDPRRGQWSFWRRRRPESNVVAILGGRGSGKTTVMTHLLESLRCPLDPIRSRSQSYILLPIIDSTFTGREDSLQYTVVSVLARHVAHSSPLKDVVKRSNAKSVKAAGWNRAQDRVAELEHFVASRDLLARQIEANQSLGSMDFGNLAIARATAIQEFGAEQLSDAVDAICFAHDADNPPHLVLTLDDLDLAPQHYLDICGVLLELMYVRRLVVILGADLDDLRLRVQDGLLRNVCPAVSVHRHPTLPEQATDYVRSAAPKMLAKLIPLNSRVRLQPLLAADRMRFAISPDITDSSASRLNGTHHESAPTIHALLERCGVLLVEFPVPSLDTGGTAISDPAPLTVAARKRWLDDYGAHWEHVLPGNVRSLVAVHEGLVAQIRTRAAAPSTDLTSQDHSAEAGRVATANLQTALAAISVLLDVCGATDAAWEFRRWRGGTRSDNPRVARLNLENDGPFHGPSVLNLGAVNHNPMRDLEAARRAAATGVEAEKIIGVRPQSRLLELRNEGHQPADWISLLWDVSLRYLPASRMDLPACWPALQSKLEAIVVKIGEMRVNALQVLLVLSRTWCSMNDDPGKSLKDAAGVWLPFGASWGDWIQLAEMLQIPIAEAPALVASQRKAIAKILPLHTKIADSENAWLNDPDGFCAGLCVMWAIKAARCSAARSRNGLRHDGNASASPATSNVTDIVQRTLQLPSREFQVTRDKGDWRFESLKLDDMIKDMTSTKKRPVMHPPVTEVFEDADSVWCAFCRLAERSPLGGPSVWKQVAAVLGGPR